MFLIRVTLLTLLLIAAIHVHAAPADCTARPLALAEWWDMEALVAVVDEGGDIERARFPWLSPQTNEPGALNAARSLKPSGFGWQVASSENEMPAPGTSRRLSIERDGRTLRLLIAKPGSGPARGARLTYHGGLLSGHAEDGLAWVFVRLRDLPAPRSMRRVA